MMGFRAGRVWQRDGLAITLVIPWKVEARGC